jgi:hypothetical protein
MFDHVESVRDIELAAVERKRFTFLIAEIRRQLGIRFPPASQNNRVRVDAFG